MPILVRPDSILVTGDFIRDFEYDYLSNAEAVIYELADGHTASAAVYDKDANLLSEIRAERTGNRITVFYSQTDRSFTVKIAGTDITARAEAGTDSVIIDLT